MTLLASTSTGIDTSHLFEDALFGIAGTFAQYAPWLVSLAIALAVLRCPMPGRGPGFLARRDPWRLFKYDARRVVMERSGGRCEGPLLLIWGRCNRPAQEADHLYPWSRGGATMPSNGQALCRSCNKSKSNLRPAWWYVRGLERRRRGYFPSGADVRVQGALSAADRSHHQAAPRPARSRAR